MTARAACCLAILAVVSWLVHRDDGGAKTFALWGSIAWRFDHPGTDCHALVCRLDLAPGGDLPGGGEACVDLLCLAFLVMPDETEHALTLGLEYGALAGLVWFEFKHARRRRHELEFASTGRCESPAFAGGERSPSVG